MISTARARLGRALRFSRAAPGALALTVLTIAAVVAATALVWSQYLPDRRTGDTTSQAALTAAKEGTVALLSYAPDTLDRDFAAAKSRLTGDFLTYYGQFTDQIVTPAAKAKSVETSAVVVRAAVSEVRPESATVLVFINQTTTSAERPEPAMTASSVRVTLTKVEESWLISSFDPV
ncbi:twin-arginine translocation pathway signal [Nocardia goodfellowii]|uniref:Mce-associated membrane protein n=1 Tax=Nocardia goodfellowii TaxID=882446 RepID=A0ABS4QLD3_9NOCA|nr:twin-arginine translocation pathway signal [Nocardia goodfellowii]MBP2191903.1 Mce-associated membrane protein [Nocardia goodfellowii]